MKMRARHLAATVWLAVLTLAACVPPPPDDDVARTFDPEETVMGVIQERGVLRIGVQQDAYPLAGLMHESNEWEGMAVDLGREVADSLRVDVEVEGFAGAEALLSAVEDDAVDLAFPVMPVTENRIKDLRDTHSFTDPYLVAHQRVLIPADSPGPPFEGLDNPTVCSFADAETGVDLAALYGVDVIAGSPEHCWRMITSVPEPQVVAVTGPDILLAGLSVRGPGLSVVGDQLNTEGYSAVVEAGAGAWTDYVDAVIEEAQQEGRWATYFEEWLRPGLGMAQDPPGMSVEEAAALFPADV